MQIKRNYPDVRFVCPSGILHKPWAEWLDAEVIRPLDGPLWEQITLPRYLRSQGDCVLLCLANTAPLFFSPLFLTLHDLAFEHKPWSHHFLFRQWYRILIPRLLGKSTFVFTVSKTMKKEIEGRYRVKSGIAITYNGLATPFKNNRPSGLKKEKILLVIGSLNPRKNIALIVEAFLQCKSMSDFQLVIIGSGQRIYPEVQWKTHVRVKNVEAATDEELMQWYQRSSLFCMLSTYEGFGLPVLEALWYGCKVLCSDIPVFKELYNPYVYFSALQEEAVIGNMEEWNQWPDTTTIPVEWFNQYSYEESARTIVNQLSKV